MRGTSSTLQRVAPCESIDVPVLMWLEKQRCQDSFLSCWDHFSDHCHDTLSCHRGLRQKKRSTRGKRGGQGSRGNGFRWCPKPQVRSRPPHRPPSWAETLAIPCGGQALAPAQPLSQGSRGRSPVSVPGPDHPQSPQHRSLTQFTNSSRKPAVCPSPPSSSPTTTNVAGCSRVDGRRLGIPEERERLRSPDTCEMRPVRRRLLPRGPGCRKGFRE